MGAAQTKETVMPSIHVRPRFRSALALFAVALLAPASAVAANAASAADDRDGAKPKHSERLVVRGDATVTDAPCDAGVCLELADGHFRGNPVGTGAYTGSIEFAVADAFPNGEGGVCAPIQGRILLGAGSPDRLTLAVAGNSCQDGAGNPATSSFTGLARFTVEHGTGAYAKATGSGFASFLEDASDQDRMTLIGSITR
jgi:hypothetical protein